MENPQSIQNMLARISQPLDRPSTTNDDSEFGLPRCESPDMFSRRHHEAQRSLSSNISPSLVRDLLAWRVLQLYSPFLEAKKPISFFSLSNLPLLDVQFVLHHLQLQNRRHESFFRRTFTRISHPAQSRLYSQVRTTAGILNISVHDILAALKFLANYQSACHARKEFDMTSLAASRQYELIATQILDDLSIFSSTSEGHQDCISATAEVTGLSVQGLLNGIRAARQYYFVKCQAVTVVDYKDGREKVIGRSVDYVVRQRKDSAISVDGSGDNGRRNSQGASPQWL